MNNLAPYIEQPHNPITNLNLGLEYEQIGQTAAAVSFYIRAAEKTSIHEIQYIALSRAAMCFEKQGNRNLTVKTLLQRAISALPTRPEAYFLLSRFYEYQKEYHDSYMFASIGLSYSETLPDRLDEISEYPGKYGLLFQKAVAGWWVGLNEESREILWDLSTNYNLNDLYKTVVQNNINNIGYPKNVTITKTINDIVTNNPDLLTDKNKHWCHYSHSYFDNFYETEFKKYQNRPISLCEIGIYLGASFLVWNEYFHKDSKLLGIDITNCVDPKYYEHNFNNVRYIFNDAYNANLVDTLGTFDIIIDDGPHTIESQLDAIKLYLPKLNDGGVFIIEDIQQLSYIDILTAAVPDQYKSNIEVINLTEIDNRYDSLLFIIRKH